MGDLQLEHCSHERDLGVWISTYLTWKKQVEAQSGKANKILSYVKRTSNSIKSIDTKRTIYLTIVRAHLAYSSPVWAPQTVDNIKNIERIQRRATKYILGLPYRCRDTYKERLLETDLIPLTYWHEYLDMVQLFKIINNINYVDKDIVPKVKTTRKSTRSGDKIDGTLVLEEQLCRTCTYARSYMVRSKRVWNTLPAEMRRNFTSLATFKTLLKQYYKNALNLCYDPEDARTWKSVCVKCNSARNLLTTLSCCF